MVALGYPGEVSDSKAIKMVFWLLGVAPFCYLIYVLYVGMSESLRRQPDSVVRTISNARLLLVSSWMVYPVVYLLPIIGINNAGGTVIRQVGYSIADVIAKPLFALFLLRVAQAKSADAEQIDVTVARAPSVPTAPVAPRVPMPPRQVAAAAQADVDAAMQAPTRPRVPMPPSMSSGHNNDI